MGKNELTDTSSAAELDGEGVGIEDLEGDFAFESGIDPSGILDKESHAPDGAAAFHEGGHIGRELDKLHGGGQDEGLGRDDDFLFGHFPVLDGGVHGDDLHTVLIQDQEVVAQAQVDGGRLDLIIMQRFDGDSAVGEVLAEGEVGEDHS